MEGHIPRQSPRSNLKCDCPAFSTLFRTFGESFFRRYAELRPIRPGFFEVRRDIYNLYPLLVHVRLFGGSYRRQVAGIVSRFV